MSRGCVAAVSKAKLLHGERKRERNYMNVIQMLDPAGPGA